ncbi:MAG: argininosuccinate synthase [Bacteroidia bacterium]|nr:argininosuccinate synthase [Bacteroidota bacterium]MCZ2130176.1 argininosuccinate synthase [Bacteroidia bacterium]
MTHNPNKLVLAFSGGLDTSFCAVYLNKVKGYEVHALMVNTGGFSDKEIAEIKEHALRLGVASFKAVDARENYYQSIIKYMVYGNVLRNNTYPLSVSAERTVQAIAVANYAQEIGATYIAHGSTGSGNDQVRFDMVFELIVPHIQVITPIRDLKLSREEEINFLKKQGVTMNFEKAAYSINKGIWGTSVGGKETLTSRHNLPESAFPSQLSSTEPREISLLFEKGELIGLDDMVFDNPVNAIIALQTIAESYAIGRDIHVGDTIIGIKGRVGFEAAAPIIIIKAHHLLEKHTLSKWQLFLKEQMSSYYGMWLHEGQYFEAAMRDIENFLQSSQENVSGKVFVRLLPYRFELIGIESTHDLMSEKFGSYGEMNKAWTGEDVKGFTKIFGNQMSFYFQVNNTIENEN